MDLSVLNDWNTHWGGAPVSPLVLRHPSARAAVPHMVQDLLSPVDDQWSLRPGPRQIGKTTSLGHVAAGLLARGVHPRQVVIAPLDQPPVLAAMAHDLQGLITAALAIRPADPAQPLFLLLDEIQELDRWDLQLKAAWDRFHDRVRVIATGSSALRLAQTTGASLANRVRVTRMFPMKFREVVQAHPERERHGSAAEWTALFQQARSVRHAFLGPGVPLRKALRSLHDWLVARPSLNSFLHATFLEHCVWGGYPSARTGSERPAIRRIEFFEAAWGSIAARDLPHANVRDVRGIQRMFRRISENTGGKFVPANVAKDAEVKADTIVSWKRLLEDLLLVQQLAPLKPNLRSARGKDKAYLVDPGWYAYAQHVLDHATVVGRPGFGALLETVLVDHFRRLRYNLLHTTTGAAGYVAEPEVDLCLEMGDRWLIVEMKGGGKAADRVRQVGGSDDIRIVASRDRARFDEPDVWVVPAHELALVC